MKTIITIILFFISIVLSYFLGKKSKDVRVCYKPDGFTSHSMVRVHYNGDLMFLFLAVCITFGLLVGNIVFSFLVADAEDLVRLGDEVILVGRASDLWFAAACAAVFASFVIGTINTIIYVVSARTSDKKRRRRFSVYTKTEEEALGAVGKFLCYWPTGRIDRLLGMDELFD